MIEGSWVPPKSPESVIACGLCAEHRLVSSRSRENAEIICHRWIKKFSIPGSLRRETHEACLEAPLPPKVAGEAGTRDGCLASWDDQNFDRIRRNGVFEVRCDSGKRALYRHNMRR